MNTTHRTAPLALLLVLACAGPQGADGQADLDPRPAVEHQVRPQEPEVALEPEPAPWTPAFTSSATLLANRVRIVGPVGLVDHSVLSSDDVLFERSVRTTSEGLLQVTRALDPNTLVRCQLDAWSLAAFEEITLLESPGATAVTVEALGEAWWRDVNGEEQRGARLTFEGVIEP